MKVCSTCKIEKELIEFSKSKSAKDGLCRVCKICAKETACKWRKQHKFDGRVIASKQCSSCNFIKSIESFFSDKSRQDGLSNQCKGCIGIFRAKNRDRLLEESKNYNKRRSEKEKPEVTGRICSQCKIYKNVGDFWRSKYSSDGLYSCCTECKRKLESTTARKENRYKCQKEWYLANKRKALNYKNNWDKQKRATDPVYKLRRNVKNAIINSLKNRKFDLKSDNLKKKIFDHLPYSAEDLKSHIESLWEPWMNWQNHGKFNPNMKTWQIDHIIPQSKLPFKSFDDDSFHKLWALQNLQPLETIANIKKSDK